MTCREEILAAMERLQNRTGSASLSLVAIVKEVQMGGGDYKESTIRTHITSSMCVDAPPNHGTRYPDLRRIGRGLYRRA